MLDVKDRATAFLESSVKNFKIFIDTCSLLSDHADTFLAHIVPILQREGKTIIVPLRVYEEVEKFANNPDLCAKKNNPNLNKNAKAALKNIVVLQKAGIVEIFGEDRDNFADNVFQTVFTQYRLKYNLMLVTQDNALANDIHRIGQSRAVNTKNQILVERINKYGYLSVHHFDGEQAPASQPATPTQVPNERKNTPYEKAEIPENECFAFATSVRKVSGTLPVSSVPGENAILIAERNGSRRQIKLVAAGPSGGEGTIYTTNAANIVAKIYKPEKLDRAKFEKLRLMMTKNIDCEGICFPMALLYNQNNEFVGYLMKQASGKELQRCVFIPQLLKKNFPNWTKADTVTLCVTILKKLKYLHERNIILGDINPNNILVVSPTEVYFVDTDSYQVEGFPCPVGTINYTAPEIQRKEFSSFLRTIGNEYFAVATLLFMIMLPGKPPYSLQGGENQIDNIINGDFAYASGVRSTGKAPEGMWRFCWSHLPRYLKDDFYETFHKDGEHSTEKTRYSTGDWLQKFERYQELLVSGKLASQDSMSMDVFPSRLKKNPNATYIKCRLCGNDVDEDRTEQGICRDCLNKGESYHCAKCGCEMLYSNYQKYIKTSPKHEICKDCFNWKDLTYISVRCSECGRVFEITNGEKEFFDKKGFALPKKCKDCRGRATYAPTAPRSYSGTTARPYTPPSTGTSSRPYSSPAPSGNKNTGATTGNSGKGNWCFITTAACEYFGKSDNCYELMMLRDFRDGWLALQPGGEALIKEYYRIAPPIVTALNASDQRDVIYHNIWDSYIIPCVHLIEQDAYEQCRTLYEKMVNDLKETVLKEN